MLLNLGGGGGAMYKDHGRGVWGHAPPGKFFTSGGFSSKFTLPMICIYYTRLTMQPCIEKKTVATKFQGGARFWQGGDLPPPSPK